MLPTAFSLEVWEFSLPPTTNVTVHADGLLLCLCLLTECFCVTGRRISQFAGCSIPGSEYPSCHSIPIFSRPDGPACTAATRAHKTATPAMHSSQAHRSHMQQLCRIHVPHISLGCRPFRRVPRLLRVVVSATRRHNQAANPAGGHRHHMTQPRIVRNAPEDVPHAAQAWEWFHSMGSPKLWVAPMVDQV